MALIVGNTTLGIASANTATPTTLDTMHYYYPGWANIYMDVYSTDYATTDGNFWDRVGTVGDFKDITQNTSWTTITDILGQGMLGAIISPRTVSTGIIQVRVTIDGEASTRPFSVPDTSRRLLITMSPPIPNSTTLVGQSLFTPYFFRSPELLNGISFETSLKVELLSTTYTTSTSGFYNRAGAMYWLNGR